MKPASGKKNITMIGDHRLARALLNAMGDGVIAFGRDGHIESVNDAAEHIFGYSKGELASLDVTALFPQAYKADLNAWFSDLAEATAPQKREISALRKHIAPFMAEVTIGLAHEGHKLLFVMTVRDISDVKKTLRKNARQIERDAILQAAAEALQDMKLEEAIHVCLALINDHYWFAAAHCWHLRDQALESSGIWVGDGFDTLRAITLQERLEAGQDLAGQALTLRHTLFAAEIGALDYLQHRDLLSGCGITSIYAVPLTYGDEMIGVMQFYNPMPARFEGEDEEFLCHMGALLGSAFHQERARHALITAREQAELVSSERADTLARLDHDLRAPIHAIDMLIGRLQESRLDTEQGKTVHALATASQSLLKILNTAHEAAAPQAGRTEAAVTPGICIERVYDFMSPLAASKGLALHCDVASGMPPIALGEINLIQQVMFNLVGNAVKYTNKGSIDLRAYTIDDGLKFEVKDTGIGIAPEFQNILFAHTAEDNDGGLSISSQLIEAMGGRIGVESEEGVGSRFWFTVPVRDTPRPNI